jgi:hypothetical protein
MVESNSPSTPLTRWGPNEPLDHRKLNEPVDAFNKFSGVLQPPKQVRFPGGTASGGLAGQQMKVVTILGDYLLCRPYDGTDPENADIQNLVAVARPRRLRCSETSRTIDGTAYTYTYTGTQARTSDNGADTEDQQIVPVYNVGDVIYAARGFVNGTGVFDSENKAVDYLDLNVDARAWAKVAT